MKPLYSPTEKDIQSLILQYLAYRSDVYVWRNNAGMVFSEYQGKTRAIKVGEPGLPDIIGLIKPSGRFLGIEVKRPGKKPTQLQQVTMEKLKKCGGLVLVATSVEEVREGLK